MSGCFPGAHIHLAHNNAPACLCVFGEDDPRAEEQSEDIARLVSMGFMPMPCPGGSDG